MSTVDTLRRARALIADEDHWTKDVYAVDAYGTAIGSNDPLAVRWCAVGAINRAVGNDNQSGHQYWAIVGALENADPVARAVGVTLFNDNHTHAEVLALFDKAIEAEA